MISSLSLFCWIASAKENVFVGKSLEKIILTCGKHCFAVYILHSSNPFFSMIRAGLIQTAELKWGGTGAFLALIPNAIVIFCVCILIDIIYEKVLGKSMLKLCEWISVNCNKIYETNINKFYKFFCKNT